MKVQKMCNENTETDNETGNSDYSFHDEEEISNSFHQIEYTASMLFDNT